MEYQLDLLEQGAQSFGISLDAHQKSQFLAYYEFLMEKNKVMNLTAITEFKEVLLKHFLDSLSCVKAADLTKIAAMIDIGTGAGFRGFLLK